MAPNDITFEVRKQPFEPFRLHLLDGTSFDIHHPDQCMVLLTAAILGVSSDPDAPHYEQYVKIDTRHVSRIVPLKPSPVPAGGTDFGD